MHKIEYITLVTDYIPIHNNEQTIKNTEPEPDVDDEVELVTEELE
jgi:hypothetical protein